MGNSSILGGTVAPKQAEGRDTDALGPSDSSDSGSDVQGERLAATPLDNGDLVHATPAVHGSDTDAGGTGERGSAVPGEDAAGADIGPDHVETLAPDDAMDDAVSIDADDIEDFAADEEVDPDDPDADLDGGPSDENQPP
ncbi:hypothetical protein V4F39_20035 [Aquincola sp. MAHUQ-54]|uniref:Chemotaxis protein n=1 Tax=Aquincola agrisoli TaxID=3119538 RepID=A0AAW9QG60_9BURK